MLKKINRLDKKSVDKVFKEGAYLNSPNLTFKYIKTPSPLYRISVVVPKSVAKLAVKRNLLRRVLYKIIKEVLIYSPKNKIWGVFVFKKYQDDISILQNEIKKILSLVS